MNRFSKTKPLVASNGPMGFRQQPFFPKRAVLKPSAATPAPAPKPSTKPPAPVVPKPPVPTRQPQVRVLLIGNNYGGTDNELLGCYNDILAMKEFIIAQADAGMGAPQFYILGDDREHVAPNGTGTGENILKGIRWLLSNALPGDSLVVHYSGHGASVRAATDKYELSGVDSAWVPVDFMTFRGGGRRGLIVDDELRVLLANAVPAGVRLWMTSDSCHSGSVLDLRYNYTDASFAEKAFDASAVDERDVLRVQSLLDDDQTIELVSKSLRTVTTVTEIKGYPKTPGSVVMLSGCHDLGVSADAYGLPDTPRPMGALTWALLNVLRKNPASPLKYLVKDVRALLKLSKFTQVPQLSSGQALDISSSSFRALVLANQRSSIL